MTGSVNVSTFDLTNAKIRLCDDVIVVPLVRGDVSSKISLDEVAYQLRSKSQGRFFQIGHAEYLFCSLLNGEHSIAQAVTLAARELKSEAFGEREATSIFTWLIDQGLAVPVNESGRQLCRAKQQQKLKWSWNPFWTKLPIFNSQGMNPDKFLAWLLPSLSWIFAPLTLLLTSVLLAWAGIVLTSHWEEFVASSYQLFAPTNWLWLAVAWLVLKILHELGHGLACKYYGGEVREMGIIMILFAPMAYVDVTSSWGFQSRWQRIHVAAAGMVIELLLASVAVLCWAKTDSEIAQHLLYNVIVMASVSTLLFNANPLMRFDGYYILSDLFRIPNLYTEAQGTLGIVVERLCYGTSTRSRSHTGWRWWFLLSYAVAAFFWKILITISLMITASVLFEGAGIVLAVIGVGLWFGMPIIKTLQSWGRRLTYRPASAVRAAVLSGIVVASLGALVFLAPCPGTAQAPGIVEYTDLSVVRAKASGFVTEIKVEAGQQVEVGELLIRLENDQLEMEVAELQASVAQSKAKQRSLRNSGEISGSQIEVRNQQAMQERLSEKQHQLSGLEIRANVAGRVSGEGLQHLVGQYLKEGQEVCVIGRDETKEFQVSVGQDVHDIALDQLGKHVPLRVSGGGQLDGIINRISPNASLIPPHTALCAPYGGELAVVEKQSRDEQEERFELSEPRFLVTVGLPEEASQRTFAGQRGALQLGFGTQTIAEVTYRSLSKWLRKKLAMARQG